MQNVDWLVAEPLSDPLAQMLLAEGDPMSDIEELLECELAWQHVARPPVEDER